MAGAWCAQLPTSGRPAHICQLPLQSLLCGLPSTSSSYFVTALPGMGISCALPGLWHFLPLSNLCIPACHFCSSDQVGPRLTTSRAPLMPALLAPFQQHLHQALLCIMVHLDHAPLLHSMAFCLLTGRQRVYCHCRPGSVAGSFSSGGEL